MPDMRGRRRKPTALRIVEGNKGKRSLPPNEPQPPVGDPEMPASVSGNEVAKQKWLELVQDTTLKGARVLTVADRHQCEIAALTYADWIAARAAHSPEAKSIVKVYQGAVDRLGLSPAMRGKVERVDDNAGKDPAEAYFGG